ncbi:DegV family protein [Peptoniphilus catoniae]|uniref:DegV family protein n=1 Tax=Peptoniphilus catoniae TaxID=1660341 RepID=UPI0010FE5181|nr:DegV family protein [Peptoniphilus catoniae]
MKVAILTDTNSGINEDQGKELGAYVLNMPIFIDGVSYYQDADLTDFKICKILEEGRKVTTSQPSMGQLIDKLEFIFKEGFEEIVYIPMSSSLSGSCNSAAIIANDYDGRVHVVDNHRISVTQKASVIKALKMAKKKIRGKEIASYLEKDACNSSIYLTVSDLDFLERGGRITSSAAKVASVLNIRPLLTIQGKKIDSFRKVRGSIYRTQIKMIDAIKTDIEKRFNRDGLKSLNIGVVGFGISKDQEKDWLKIAREEFPEVEVYYDPLPISIGIHTGPGAFGIGVSADYED